MGNRGVARDDQVKLTHDSQGVEPVARLIATAKVNDRELVPASSCTASPFWRLISRTPGMLASGANSAKRKERKRSSGWTPPPRQAIPTLNPSMDSMAGRQRSTCSGSGTM